MAHLKVFARRTLIVAAFLGFFAGTSMIAYHAAGVALGLHRYSASR